MEGYADILDRLVGLVGDPRTYSPEELASVIAEALAAVPDGLVMQVLNNMGDGSTEMPESPLAQAQILDPKYRERPHLVYLNDRIMQAVTDVENGQNRMIRVSMPPREGKSSYVSQHLPTWLLRKHPDWKIGMVSYADPLAVSWGRAVRRLIESHPELGIKLAPDLAMAAEWQTDQQGGVVSRGINSGYTGLGFKVLIIDDPVKGTAEAHSKAYRDAQWERWTSDLFSRLEGPYLVIVLGCLAGDTLILMADGSQKPIRDVRIGDWVATFENGVLSAAPVTRWGNQGPDHVYSVTMASGRVVKANARHPFRVVDAEGNESWRRTSELQPGDLIRSAESTVATAASIAAAGAAATTTGTGATDGPTPSRRTTGASGAARRVPKTAALNRLARRAFAFRTTTRPAGQPDTDARLLNRTGAPTSDTGTASTPRTTSRRLRRRAVFVQSASGLLTPRTLLEEVPSSLTTVTTVDASADFSATTATSSSAAVRLWNGSLLLSNTSEPGTDTVTSVEITGYEDVFDIEVERTHNFVANGLQVSNTRWHEDDFIGRIGNKEYTKNVDAWETIAFPAIAEAADVLGRAPGDPLYSPLLEETREEAIARWDEIRATVGSYHWAALYQQHPAPSKGTIFDISTFRYWTTNPDRLIRDENGVVVDDSIMLVDPEKDLGSARWLDSWDMAFKGTDTSDWVVGQRWARLGPNRFLIAQKRGKWTFTQSLAQVREWARSDDDEVSPWGRRVHQRLIEDKANGTAIIDVLHREVSGVKEMPANVSKESRARAITPEVESGHVYLPHPDDPGNEWVPEAIDELRDFNHGSNDDVVDALVHALTELRDGGVGMVTVPKRSAAPRQTAASVLTARRSGMTGARVRGSGVRIPGR